jgi:hypothetical protein
MKVLVSTPGASSPATFREVGPAQASLHQPANRLIFAAMMKSLRVSPSAV